MSVGVLRIKLITLSNAAPKYVSVAVLLDVADMLRANTVFQPKPNGALQNRFSLKNIVDRQTRAPPIKCRKQGV